MNWITTNIRLPEDLYMKLKMEAARTRKSVAAVMREKIAGKAHKEKKRKKEIDKFFRELDAVAEQIAKETKGVNLTQALIDMRYEQ